MGPAHQGKCKAQYINTHDVKARAMAGEFDGSRVEFSMFRLLNSQLVDANISVSPVVCSVLIFKYKLHLECALLQLAVSSRMVYEIEH